MTTRRQGAPGSDGADSPGDLGAAAPGPTSRIRSWELWNLPRRVLAFVLVVDAVAAVAGTALGLSGTARPHDLLIAGVLAVGAMVHLEAARQIERLRNAESCNKGAPYVDAKSMWSFAGLVLLTPGPALLLVLFTLVWWRVRVTNSPPMYRWVYSGATIVLGSVAASALLLLAGPDAARDLTDRPEVVAVLVAAALVRWTVNHGLVVTVIGLMAPSTPWRRRVGSLTDNLIGLGALALGIALAVLVETSPWLVPILLLPVLAMHHGVLLGTFARAARTDPKTGLATLAHWRDHAARELARVRRRGGRLGVLMLDLDEFKAINDRFGHVTGDIVLRAVADAVRDEFRAEDAVGRFGGEEFVVLVVEAAPEQLAVAAERVRARIAACEGVPGASGAEVGRLTVSVGAAAYPSAADDLDGLVAAADAALLAAKRAGRDCVRVAG